MGADLILMGFTAKNGVSVSTNEVRGALTAVVDDPAFWEKSGLDQHPLVESNIPCEGDEWEPEEISDGREALLGYLLTGLDEYDYLLCHSPRYGCHWQIPGGERVFVTAGGTSFGDDPFEGYTHLDLFLEVANANKSLAEMVGFCGFGIEP